MNERLVPDPAVPGAFSVRIGDTAQSWVDPARPDHLVFEYVLQISWFLDSTVLVRPADERIRVVHVGGGGLTLPRWVEWRRPRSAQIVLEPDSELVDEVRRKLPLVKFSGIKIREVDGATGISAMPDDYADAMILDAFDGNRVPASLAAQNWFEQVRRVLRIDGVLVMNLTDTAPFDWARRCVSGMRSSFRHLALGGEPAVLKGRRFGNLVVAASGSQLPVSTLTRRFAGSGFPCRLIHGKELAHWIGGAQPFSEDEAEASPVPTSSRFWFA